MNRPNRDKVKSSYVFALNDNIQVSAFITLIISVVAILIGYENGFSLSVIAGSCFLYLSSVFLFRYVYYERFLSAKSTFNEYEKTDDGQIQALLSTFNDEKLIKVACHEMRKTESSQQRIGMIQKELAERGLLASDTIQSIFKSEFHFSEDQATIYVSDKCIAIELWLKEEFKVYRIESIIDFFISSYPSIGKRGVNFGFRYKGKRFKVNVGLLEYAPYKQINNLMKAVSELGYSVQDERKPNDRSRRIFENLGINIPSESASKNDV